jgi:two-component sensor histidine kinase/CheY-like chemotaxis protein
MKILVIEDNPADVEMIRELLEGHSGAGFEVVNYERLGLAIEHLSHETPDIILSDLGLPDSQGMETLRTLKGHASEVPIVVLTGTDDESVGIEALKNGAQEYLVKSHMTEYSLARSLRYAIERKIIETERRKMELQITRQLKEKEMLIKEIHHRVKNNLQIISALFLLQSEAVKDEATKAVFNECQNRIRSISLVHEQLYRSNDLNQIEYGDYLQKMFLFLFESYGTDPEWISMEIDVQDVMITIEKAVPCSLIVNELLSNSLKYAFPKEQFPRGKHPEMRIRFFQDTDPDAYVLEYRDNGVGLPPGMDPRQTGTLGMQLIYGLTEQLAGTVSLESNEGIHYTIIFPAKEQKEG